VCVCFLTQFLIRAWFGHFIHSQVICDVNEHVCVCVFASELVFNWKGW